MGYFTETQIRSKADAIIAAMDVVLSGGKTYRINDGQADIQVTRSSLGDLQKSLDYWLVKFEEIDAGSGVVSIQVGR